MQSAHRCAGKMRTLETVNRYKEGLEINRNCNPGNEPSQVICSIEDVRIIHMGSERINIIRQRRLKKANRTESPSLSLSKSPCETAKSPQWVMHTRKLYSPIVLQRLLADLS